MPRLDRDLVVALGTIGPILAVGLVFVSTLVDPAFDWRTRSLSSIGEATGSSLLALTSLDQLAFTLFNGGLIGVGVLGLPVAYGLWEDAETTLERVGVVSFAVTLLALAAVGVAYLDGPYAGAHFPAALTFFVGVVVTLWVHGTGLIQRTGPTHGLAAIWLANASLIGWLVWILFEAVPSTQSDRWSWFAVPEFVAALAFAAWVVLQARRLDHSV